MVQWKNFVEWAFYGLISYVAWGISQDIDSMKTSIIDLNKSVVVVITKDEVQQEEIRDMKRRLERLEFPHATGKR
jgi:hypothetical protein